MTLDYCYHVLRLFHPRAATAALHARVQEFIRALNANNAALLERACGFAEESEHASTREVAQFSESLAKERIAFDTAAAPRSQDLLCDIHGAAADMAEARWPNVASVSRAAAAVTVLVTVLGSKAHAFEMVPPPMTHSATGPGPDTGRSAATPGTNEKAFPGNGWPYDGDGSKAPATGNRPPRRNGRGRR
jgi:hypothetical protein